MKKGLCGYRRWTLHPGCLTQNQNMAGSQTNCTRRRLQYSFENQLLFSAMKTFVTSDIHGNLDSLLEVIHRSKINKKEDRLIVLGDTADGFPYTKDCFDILCGFKHLVYVWGNHDCLSSDTEILTGRGWISYDKLMLGDLIYSIDPIQNKGVWETVDKIIIRHHNGYMVRIQTEKLDILMTPNHRVLCKRRKQDKFRQIHWGREWEFIPAAYLSGRIKIPTHCKVSVSDLCEFDWNKSTALKEYNGAVWCITTKHSNFLARRNGKPFFTGNCWYSNWIKTGTEFPAWIHQGGLATMRSYSFDRTTIPKSHKALLKKAKYYYVDEQNRLYVHGGYNPKISIVDQDIEILTWDRGLIKYAQTNPILNYNNVFVGHTTTQLFNNSTKPQFLNNLVMCDTGAGWNGKLTMIDADTFEYWQSEQRLQRRY